MIALRRGIRLGFCRTLGRRGNLLKSKPGRVIPGVMLTGINSDLPGTIIAQVSQNVFDTGTGQQLLIPRGAKLYGVYDSRVVYGQGARTCGLESVDLS